jgi:acyl carrier protein
MDREGIRKTVIELLETDLGESLDSVDVVSVVSQIERRFRIRLSPAELEKLVCVGDLLDLLEVKIAEAAANPAPAAPGAPNTAAA